MAARPYKVMSYRFSVELKIPAHVQFPTDKMIGNMLAAIDAYDDRNRFFEGRRLEDGMSCIIEKVVGLEGIGVADEQWPRLNEEPVKRPFEEESTKDLDETIDISCRSDGFQELLEETRAKMWEAYHDVCQAETRNQLRGALARLRRRRAELAKMVGGSSGLEVN